VRIVAGEFGGRRPVVPADARVRPTADRTREAWFSILGGKFDGAGVNGARVLDLYAGSGALGLEALSRGAREVTFVEISASSLAAIERNLDSLGVRDRCVVVRRDAIRFVDRLEPLEFDLALADPPYGHRAAPLLAERFRLRPFARILAIEHDAAQAVVGDETRRYGDTAITFCHAP
jgi:16S rRNA (guanine966-N2)-methyltransferase